ncbi:hypothetical protein MWN52_04655 [Pseudoxanthomonas winnipegensis]|uniref:hypothetical protein n=1 Tax=Pseudoxanthomonas winnipegensis TaxID=2480810 RepID=UPI002577E88D|nr:hypothetical protein [Pseudoxanthomonas winnipegensis]WJI16590.1 hypothetical protein MWN52_04655 [Pseudoxanthomonas winnipegensis]
MPPKPSTPSLSRKPAAEQADQALIQAAIAEAHRRIKRMLSAHFHDFTDKQQRQVRALLSAKQPKAATPVVKARPRRKAPL